MFLQNKYRKWYLELTSKSGRELSCYTEKHHIIPKSLGGNDDKSNIVILTAKEHYIAHLLLTKITSGVNRHKMIHAFIMMSQCKDPQQERILKINSSLYNSLKEQSISLKKQFKHSEEAKNRIREYQTGKPKEKFSETHKKNLSESLKGNTAWNKGAVGLCSHSDETKKKMSDSHKGKIKSESTRQKLRDAHKGKISCFDLKTMSKVHIDTNEFKSSSGRYIGFKSKMYQTEYKVLT
jgi:hypothetical protein